MGRYSLHLTESGISDWSWTWEVTSNTFEELFFTQSYYDFIHSFSS